MVKFFISYSNNTFSDYVPKAFTKIICYENILGKKNHNLLNARLCLSIKNNLRIKDQLEDKRGHYTTPVLQDPEFL